MRLIRSRVKASLFTATTRTLRAGSTMLQHELRAMEKIGNASRRAGVLCGSQSYRN